MHNPTAGNQPAPDCAEIVAALRALGWSAKLVDGRRLDPALRDPGGAVLVAGGDGTVGLIAKRLAGTGVPIAVIPTGVANNVARTLGVGVEVRAAIDNLRNAVIREVDLGVVASGRGGVERFLEGFGIGLFATVMAQRATKSDKGLSRALTLIAQELEAYRPKRIRIEVDGLDLSGEYLLASVMNLRSLGPDLVLAPDALLDDGLVDVVLVRPELRESLLAHLRRSVREDRGVTLPRFEVHRARSVRLSGQGHWAHVDDGVRELAEDLEVRVEPHTVKFLVPVASL